MEVKVKSNRIFNLSLATQTAASTLDLFYVGGIICLKTFGQSVTGNIF